MQKYCKRNKTRVHRNQTKNYSAQGVEVYKIPKSTNSFYTGLRSLWRGRDARLYFHIYIFFSMSTQKEHRGNFFSGDLQKITLNTNNKLVENNKRQIWRDIGEGYCYTEPGNHHPLWSTVACLLDKIRTSHSMFFLPPCPLLHFITLSHILSSCRHRVVARSGAVSSKGPRRGDAEVGEAWFTDETVFEAIFQFWDN